MELIIPLIFSIGAFILLLLGLCFKYMWDTEEIFLLTELMSTICFFVGGACFLGVTYVDPTTGAVIQTIAYNWLIWLMVPFGFIPITLLYEHTTGGLSGDE